MFRTQEIIHANVLRWEGWFTGCLKYTRPAKDSNSKELSAFQDLLEQHPTMCRVCRKCSRAEKSGASQRGELPAEQMTQKRPCHGSKQL